MLKLKSGFTCVSALALISVFLLPEARGGSGVCAADREKFCAGIERGDGRIAECMRSHESELSHKCQEFRQAIQAERQEMRDACATEMEQYCSWVKPGPGGGTFFQCLKDLKKKGVELSQSCKQNVGDVARMKRSNHNGHKPSQFRKGASSAL